MSRKDPLMNCNFCLRIEGTKDLPCKSVHALEYNEPYEYIQEGGLNDYVHIVKGKATAPHTFQVERYVGIENDTKIKIGEKYKVPLLLLISRKQNDFENPDRVYAFMGAVVTGKTYSEVNAESASIMVETITFTYQQMVCVDE